MVIDTIVGRLNSLMPTSPQSEGRHMPWNAVQMPNLLAAMNECDGTTLVAFRTKYGAFCQATDLHMYYGERGPYEARPLLAAAYAKIPPGGARLGKTPFVGRNGHDFLINLGFREVKI
jgi:hypothetical protein